MKSKKKPVKKTMYFYYMTDNEISVREISEVVMEEKKKQEVVEVWDEAQVIEISTIDKRTIDIEMMELFQGENDKKFLDNNNVKCIFSIRTEEEDVNRVSDIFKKVTKEYSGFVCSDSEDFKRITFTDDDLKFCYLGWTPEKEGEYDVSCTVVGWYKNSVQTKSVSDSKSTKVIVVDNIPSIALTDISVTAPEGETTFSSEVTVFEETFDKITKNASNVTTQGGNSNGQVSGNDQWSGSAGATDWSTASTKLDNAGWSADRGGGGYQCAKFGASSNKGYAITPALGEAGNFTLTFKAGAWSGDKTTDGLVLSIEAGTGTLGTSTFTLKDGEWDTYETTITGASTTTKIKFSAAQSSKNRFFLDEVKVTKTVPSTSTVTLNKYGYATYCSVNPIDCSALTGCTAWRVSDIDGTTITFTKITEKIKGGQGILLYNKDADGVNTSEATITFADGSTAFTAAENNLVGTTAPQYVTAGQYYGLKGNAFVPVNAGTVPAGKALLPAGAIPASARELTFVFEGDETTGVKTIDNGQFSIDNEAVYDLQGRKVTKPVKGGLYIVNGKKVIK